MSAMITASTTSASVRVRVAPRARLEPRLARFAPRALAPASTVSSLRGCPRVAPPPEDAPEPERIDRDNLDERYYRGFLESSLGPDDSVQADGRDTLTASVKLGAQATAVLGAPFTAFREQRAPLVRRRRVSGASRRVAREQKPNRSKSL